MTNGELCWLSAAELTAAVRRKEVSPVEVTEAVLARIERLNPTLNAYCTITADLARRTAKAAERALVRRERPLGPLHGVPFSVKDLVFTKGVRTTFGSKLLADNVPGEDAPVVERMKAAGAIMVGKTNTPENGWLGVTQNPLFGETRNPWSLRRTPGGSSGGASAAVAAGMAPLAVGTDAGGSIRIPAALSGVFGIKPSFGRVPVHPFSPLWSLSHVGPLTRTVTDAALMLTAIAGPDPRDAHSLPASRVDYVKQLEGDLKGLRVAWSPTLGFAPVDTEVAAICQKAARSFRDFGCRLATVDPKWADPHDAWKTTFQAGAATRLEPFLADRRGDIDPGLVELVDEGLTWPATRLIQAWFDRLTFCGQAHGLFERFDLLLTPTVPTAAFKLGLRAPARVGGKRVSLYGWVPFSYPFNLTGQPAASVPCGFTKDGLPVGLQIVGRRFEDATVLRAAACFERAQPWASARPPFANGATDANY